MTTAVICSLVSALTHISMSTIIISEVIIDNLYLKFSPLYFLKISKIGNLFLKLKKSTGLFSHSAYVLEFTKCQVFLKALK